VQPLLGRNILRLVLTAPILHQEIHLGQCFLDFFRIGTGFIHLVDGEDNGNISSRGMVDGLNGLRHHVVVCGHNDDGDVGNTGSTGTHGGKRFMTRGIEKGYLATTRHLDVIGANVLGDTTSLTGDDVGLADIVEQRGFTMIDVTHHRHNGWTGDQIFLVVLFHVDGFHDLGTDVVGLEAEFVSDKVDGFCIQPLIDGYHLTDRHAHRNNFDDRYVHHVGKVVDRDKLGDLDDSAFFALTKGLILSTLRHDLPFFFPVLGAFFGF